MRSCNVVAGTEGLTAIASGAATSSVTGVKLSGTMTTIFTILGVRP